MTEVKLKEPEWRIQSESMEMKQGLGLNGFIRMELFIETLTGTAFELRVSPFETIMSVKAKIQRLEGKPMKFRDSAKRKH